jgi:hypothetical protein
MRTELGFRHPQGATGASHTNMSSGVAATRRRKGPIEVFQGSVRSATYSWVYREPQSDRLRDLYEERVELFDRMGASISHRFQRARTWPPLVTTSHGSARSKNRHANVAWPSNRMLA